MRSELSLTISYYETEVGMQGDMETSSPIHIVYLNP